ncbi:MAG: hypothetical protein FWE62_00385 [Firmicutes bacterium]|nr:hypothetical protein [Bacillota bacterium]
MLIERGGRTAGRLAFAPVGKTAVAAGGAVYREGADYVIEGREIVAVSDRMPGLKAEWLRGENIPREITRYQGMYGLGTHLFAEGSFLMERQILVSYAYEPRDWAFSFEKYPAALLPRFKKMLANKKSPRVLLYGDSISGSLFESILRHTSLFAALVRALHAGA